MRGLAQHGRRPRSAVELSLRSTFTHVGLPPADEINGRPHRPGPRVARALANRLRHDVLRCECMARRRRPPQRAGVRRLPIPSRRLAGASELAGSYDDLEARCARPARWWCQGRARRGSEGPSDGRDRRVRRGLTVQLAGLLRARPRQWTSSTRRFSRASGLAASASHRVPSSTSGSSSVRPSSVRTPKLRTHSASSPKSSRSATS